MRVSRVSAVAWLMCEMLLAACPIAGVSADNGAAACPGSSVGADAAEQVVCWAALDAKHDARCEASGCNQHIVAHCKAAVLDMPAVGHACFLAQIRAGDFAAALELSEYLQEPTAEVQRCQQMLSSVTQARIITNPRGAIIEVDGVNYGPAPLTVTLKSHFWERRVRATFADASGSTTLDVSEVQLRAAFDARACAMGDIVVEHAPKAAAPMAIAKPEPRRLTLQEQVELRRAMSMERGSTHDEPASTSSHAWIWALGGSVVGAGVATGFHFLGNSQYAQLETQCAPTCSPTEVSDSGVKRSDTLTVGFGVLSGVLLVTSIILAATNSADEARPIQASRRFNDARLVATF